MKKQFKLLISSVGRRAQLIQCFRRAAHTLNIDLAVVGTDAAPNLSPASHLVDRCFEVPRCSDPSFAEGMRNLCRREEIDLLVPTIDYELAIYASERSSFEEAGTSVLISSPDTVQIASDKVRTNRWFTENGFPTVRQSNVQSVIAEPNKWTFPIIVKPRQGSASVGVRIVHSPDMLHEFSDQPDLIVEQLATGIEHTTNVFVDKQGRCLAAVPHQRLETRAGEVSKGRTVKNLPLMELARSVAEKLPGAKGPLNIQGFVGEDGTVLLTEINARFGGGFPLACEAGADFCRWIFEEALTLPSTASFSAWRNNLLMLRFDEAVFVQG